MLFLLYLTIVHCKTALEDPIPTPEAYPRAVSVYVMDISGERVCIPKDPDCPVKDFDKESTYNCGQICWSNSSDVSFSHTFKGVQFLVYGNKNPQYNTFDLYFDGKKLATIDEHIDEGEENYSLLYTSREFEYGEHTITAKGNGDTFSLFKFAFWPHKKARRINITDFSSTGIWILESDEIGGTRAYSQQMGSTKSLTIEASKLWVYGSPDPRHGKLRISFNTIDEIVDTEGPREMGKLIFESELLPSTFHQLDLSQAAGKAVMVYCVYYLYDPPQPTAMPYPSRSPHPDADTRYIDKVIEKESINQLTESTKQISGCKFIDIKCPNGSYFVALSSDLIYYNNRVEFSEASPSNPAPLSLLSTFTGQFTISQCTFIKCVGSDGEGNVINCGASAALFIEECRFVNCYALLENKENLALVRFNAGDTGSVKFTDCVFQFSTDTQACPALYGQCREAVFERCTFSKCGAASFSQNVNNFQFVDSIVTYSSMQAIELSRLTGTANITGNAFKFNQLRSANNLVSLASESDSSQISVTRNEFINCKCFGSEAASFTVKVSGKLAEIEHCQFSFEYNNANSACGAILSEGKGISCKYCTFTKTYAQGAITVKQTNAQIDPVDVSNCIFDECAGTNTRCFSLTTFTTELTFSNNVVQNMKATGSGHYFGLFKPNNVISEVVLDNITFVDNNCNSQYGGGIGLWIQNTETVFFKECKFINNVALSASRSAIPTGMSSYTSGDGGAFQYGFTKSIYKINMKFDHCTFSRNKAVRHGGALAIQTVGTVEITNCTFEQNEANYKPSSLNLLGNYFNLKTEGRGGAIYINPSFEVREHNPDTDHLKSIKIDHCTFTSNSAFDGFAIYIEGDDKGTEFVITENTFTNNYDGTENSQKRGVIISEYNRSCTENILGTTNKFVHPPGYTIFDLICVNHSALTPAPTPMPTMNNLTFENAECEPRCFYSEEQPVSPTLFVLEDKYLHDKLKNDDDGSSVYIKNSGISVLRCNFSDCESPNHSGGAIYINNDVALDNNVLIDGTEFLRCKSTLGGAVYVRSTFEDSTVTISSCLFKNNQLVNIDESKLYGGSAIFLNARQGLIIECSYSRNIGKGGAIKIYNLFDDESSGSNLLSNFLNRKSVLISDCIFEIDSQQQSSSIYYQAGKFGSKFDLRNCQFNGELALNSHHIDGKLNAFDSPKLNIRNCRFDGDYKSSLNLNGDFMSINLKEQVFTKDSTSKDALKSEQKLNFTLLTVAGLLTVAVIAVVAFVVLKIKKSKRIDDEDEKEDADEQL